MSTKPAAAHIHETVLRTASRSVSVRTPEGVQEFSAIEVALRQIEKTANGGSLHAQRHLFERIAEATAAVQHKIEGDVEHARKMKENLAKARQAAIKKGEDPETVLPCSDDIEIYLAKGYVIKGPIDEKELKQTYNSMKFRDALILQYALEERLTSKADQDERPYGSPMAIAILINDMLPKRFRVTDNNMLDKYQSWDRLTKRELLKQCHQAWQNLRVPVPRGFVFPDINSVAPKLVAVQRAAKLIDDEEEAGKALSTRQVADQVMRIHQEVVDELESDLRSVNHQSRR